MISKLLPILIIFIGGIFLTIGDIVAKEWTRNNKLFLYFIVLLLYLIGLNFLIYSFKYKNIAIASMMFVVFNIVTLSLVSWLVFKEQLTTLDIVGIALGLISVSILEFSHA